MGYSTYPGLNTLRELDVSGSSITRIGFEEGVKSLPNLEILNLSGCYILTDVGLVEILSISGKELRSLNVQGRI